MVKRRGIARENVCNIMQLGKRYKTLGGKWMKRISFVEFTPPLDGWWEFWSGFCTPLRVGWPVSNRTHIFILVFWNKPIEFTIVLLKSFVIIHGSFNNRFKLYKIKLTSSWLVHHDAFEVIINLTIKNSVDSFQILIIIFTKLNLYN